MKKALTVILAKLKPLFVYFIFSGAFLFFLLTIPSINKLTLTCLKHIPGDSFAFEDCNTKKALDHFITVALAGLSVMLLLTYLFGRANLKACVIVAVCLTAATIAAYYIYMPYAEVGVKSAPIRLEELLKHKN